MKENIASKIDFENPKIIYSKSRRFRGLIDIDSKGKIIIKVPARISQEEIKKKLEENKNRLIEKYINIRKRPVVEQTFQPGEDFFYLGKKYKLELMDTNKKTLEFKKNKFYISKKHKNIKQAFINWYKKIATKYLPKRLEYYKNKFDFPQVEFKLGRGIARLGHTEKSIYKSINEDKKTSWITRSYVTISWKIILAPKEVIDYIIIHELSHFIEPGHSKEFWDVVSRLCPDYKEQEQWLKKNGHILQF